MAAKRERYKGKILIINDVPSVTEHLVRWVAWMGYRYVLVGSDNEANVLLEHEHFDAVVRGREFLL